MKCVTISDFEQYKGICVLCETLDGQLTDAAIELVSEGRRQADSINTTLTALLLGTDVARHAKTLGGYGADRVIICDDPILKEYTTGAYAKVVCDIVEELKPDIFLISATTSGRDLAPRCAARLQTGLNADCTILHSKAEEYLAYVEANSANGSAALEGKVDSKGLKMTMPAFGGKMMATIICPEYRPQMATVRPGVMEAGEYSEEKAAACVIENHKCSLTEADKAVKILNIRMNEGGSVDISKAEVIVSVGHGIGSNVKRGIALAEELAELLGGTLGATRDVVSDGWVSEDRMIGQTGKIVRPKLYIALGISGAIQHVGGMKDSDYIVAINKDSKAPIFEVANVGLVGDLFDIVPKLIAEIKAARGEK